MTPEQVVARQAEEAAARAAASAATEASKRAEEMTAFRCKAKSICKTYGRVRQECATAGNYKNCLRIKMGSEAYEIIDMCTEEGETVDPSPPSAVDCFFY
jgi:hypothetical protein